ncbi:DUF5723 family protein [Seonamhaeicola aphaedonensis]|uniref:DUF5723 domain-containing protein n=1 Tax=Seonamhaeicola aphaedonensis TaxID=1461338 RepID=A0A3D9HKP2_9FLAO|nr:DUF5723 family protein [Seonamhaeicola aphaedonensis]RED50044.1 hypothetical protein DFQ02_10164 [Seonamhaeicola aphaedonensis]
MRRCAWFVILLVGVSYAQNKQILYGFTEIPQSLLQNPGGKISNDWYFGIPLLSHIHANGGSSGVTIYDLFAVDGENFNTKLERVVYSLKPTDFFTFNQQLEIVSGGFAFDPSYNKNQYISFGLYQEVDAIIYFPQDYAKLVYEGNQNNINRPFRLDHLNGTSELISVLHIGYNKVVNDKFTYGIRGKVYNSITNINSLNNKGTFITVNGDNNVYDHIFDLDLSLKTSGLVNLTTDSDFETKDITKQILFGGNLGLGVDLGFSYQINKQWYLDGSLLDIGFINHGKHVENYELKGNYVFEGINPIFPEVGSGQTADEYWTEIEQEFEDLFTIDTTKTKYTTWRPIKLNTSLNYTFGKRVSKECDCTFDDSGYLNRIGLQLYAVNRPKLPQVALTAYYYRRLLNGLSIKAAYTLDSYSFSNIGIGMSAQLGGINFYIMADNFLNFKNIYNAQSLSLQLGFNYIFTKDED